MYYTAQQINDAGYTTLSEAKRSNYSTIISKLIDSAVGYNLINADREITFIVTNPIDEVYLPFGKINSIVTMTLDGTPITADYFSDNLIGFSSEVTSGKLYIKVNAGHGANAGAIEWLQAVFYGMLDMIIQVEKAKGEDGNVSNITIGELSKSYNTKITNEQATTSLADTLVQPYENVLEVYKYLFYFENKRFLGS